MTPSREPRSWARIAVIFGIVAVATYALISAVDLPRTPALLAACVFGPSLAAASAGLYHVLRLHRATPALQIGVVANVVAGATVTIALLAQLGFKRWLEIKFPGSHLVASSPAYQAANGIQLGIDVAWDLFIGIGTALFARGMWDHPRFGRVFAVTGILIAAMLVSFNLATFPEPPGETGFFDAGVFVGLWYLAVAIRIAMSMRWIDERAAVRSP